MKNTFVDDFHAECLSKGSSSPRAICVAAKSEISAINLELDRLITLKNNLQSVVNAFGGNEKKPLINNDVELDKLDPENLKSSIIICDYIDKKSSPVLPRELMDHFKIEANNVYAIINYLLKKKILDRDECSKNRYIILGKNWDQRPQVSV